MKKVDLSIIIVNYNTKELLRQCLKSLIFNIQYSIFNIEIIVVDNGSTDGSPEMVKKEFPTVRLIKNKINRGFAAANNQGGKIAKGKYCLFLNPDTIVPPGTIPFMLSFMENHPQVGAATCRVELRDGSLDQASHRGFPTPWNAFCYFTGLAKIFPKIKLFSGYSLTYLPLSTIHEIDSGCGAFLIIPQKVGRAVGWWDEDYFWYGEDLDLCYRIKEKGWKVMFVPDVKIIHYKGAASGIKETSGNIAKATRETRLRSAKASIEAMRIFYKKHYLHKYPLFVWWLVWAGIKLLEIFRLIRFSLKP